VARFLLGSETRNGTDIDEAPNKLADISFPALFSPHPPSQRTTSTPKPSDFSTTQRRGPMPVMDSSDWWCREPRNISHFYNLIFFPGALSQACIDASPFPVIY
jgi:hypothetical protein